MTREEFLRRVESGWFLEWAEYAGNLYGTPLWTLEEDLSLGFDVILEIELQGADQVLSMREDVVMIYIMPPSLEELERRLRGRDTETEKAILSRLARAREEMTIVQDKQREGLPPMHYAIVNDSQERASAELAEIIELARMRDEQADSR